MQDSNRVGCTHATDRHTSVETDRLRTGMIGYIDYQIGRFANVDMHLGGGTEVDDLRHGAADRVVTSGHGLIG